MSALFSRKQKNDHQPQRRRTVSNHGPKEVGQEETRDRYAFRRNRTLTGSSSSKIASSNEMNAELRSPRAHVHHLSSRRRRLSVYFGAAVIACGALLVLVTQLVASVSVQVNGVPLLSHSQKDKYQTIIDDYYAARPIERLQFLLNRDELVAHMQSRYPEVKSLDIAPSDTLGRIQVQLQARQPIARWSINNRNEYVDTQGVVFDTNYYDTPNLEIVDNSGLQTNTNGVITSHRFLGFVGRVVGYSDTKSLKVKRVTIPLLTTRQVDIALSGVGPRFKLTVDRSAAEQIEDVERIVRYIKRHNVQAGYIDVRVKGKAFYR